MANKNENLHQAKSAKNDEFYTQLTDINTELAHYEAHFVGKVVYCNCNDPRKSAFFHYFSHRFGDLKLAKFISTNYKNPEMNPDCPKDFERAIYLEYDGAVTKTNKPNFRKLKRKRLKGDGDFRRPECVKFLDQANIIVVTNPPFSLFREYVAQLIKYNKKFLIIGNINAITYKEIFKLIQDGKLWLGYNNGNMAFETPDHSTPRKTEYQKDAASQKGCNLVHVCWFTNLNIPKQHDEIPLFKTYTPEEYPTYDNYDAINVDRVCDIPKDYFGVMGVPITFLEKHNPKQFELLGIDRVLVEEMTGKVSRFRINGREIYARIVIKRKVMIQQ